MGTLANSLFQGLLGWIRALSVQVWHTVSSPESPTLLSWIGGNWKILAIVLGAAGLVMELIVYRFRGQPYRVWASFFRRRRSSRDDEPVEPEPEKMEDPAGMLSPAVASMRMTPRTETSPAEGTGQKVSLRKEMPGESAEEEREEEDPREWETEEAQRRQDSRRWYTDEQETEADPEEEKLRWSRNEPEGTTAAFEQAILPRRRRRVARLFAEGDDLDIASPDQLIDRNAAYRRPVYPRSWHAGESDQGENT